MDEIGDGAGENFNVNLPLAPGTTWGQYAGALDAARRRLQSVGADYLVVALGVDTYVGDPARKTALEFEDFSRLGEFIAALQIPTMFVFEGGYNLEAIGECVAGVLIPNDG